jgi:TM2 domain-containing membrane protein YozV
MKCGYTKTKFNPLQGAMQKSSGTTNLLSILLSLLLLTNGTGHLYLGQIGKGIGLMIGGWVLWGAGIATIWFGVGIIFIIGGFVIMIYSMVDANKQCKIYNEFVNQNGRPPW